MLRSTVLACLLALSVHGLAPSSANAQEIDAAMILEELTVELDLTDEQAQQVGGLLQQFAIDLAEATEQAEGEEPDGQKMLSDVKAVRAKFREGMQGVLTPEQFEAFEVLVESVFQEIFAEIAELKITDLRPVLDLSDDQAAALKPVMGSAMVRVLVEYGDKRMNTRTKLRMANALKKIQADMKAGMGEILTPEQMAAYDAYKEAQKEAQGS